MNRFKLLNKDIRFVQGKIACELEFNRLGPDLGVLPQLPECNIQKLEGTSFRIYNLFVEDEAELSAILCKVFEIIRVNSLKRQAQITGIESYLERYE